MEDKILAWVDLEMTGLEPKQCAIVEMAMILTDRDLNPIGDPMDVIIWQPESVLQAMTPFVRNMHEQSGLLAKIRSSQTSLEDAEKQALELLCAHAKKNTAHLCGNSIWVDRVFLKEYMPLFEAWLHYRQIDVSSIKQLGDWWYNKVYEKPEQGKHTALCDIQQSIAELKFLRTNIFR